MTTAERTNHSWRIGIVVPQLSQGGAERQVVLLAKGLRINSVFEPIIFCLSNSTEPNGSILDGLKIKYYFFPHPRAKYLQKLFWLAKVIKKTNCDLVYGILNVGNIYGGIAAILLRLPFIASIRSANSTLPFLIRVLSGCYSQRANFIIANSKSCIASLRNDLGVTHKRVALIPNSIQVCSNELINPKNIKEEFNIPSNSIIVGTVALLKQEKRPDYFIEVGLEIIKTNRSAYLIWIGDGPEKDAVVKRLNTFSKGVKEHFIFPGPRNDVMEYLVSYDMFILTSEYEGMPNALLEAMSVGLPCVATNVVGIKDVLDLPDHESVGVLASSSNPKEFANEVFRLLNDRERMLGIGIAAQKYVNEHYSLEKMTSAYCDVFYKVLSQRGREEIAN